MTKFQIFKPHFGAGQDLFDPATWDFGDFFQSTPVPPSQAPVVGGDFDTIFFDSGDALLCIQGTFGSSTDSLGVPTSGTLLQVSLYSHSGMKIYTMHVNEDVAGFRDQGLDTYIAGHLDNQAVITGTTGGDYMVGSSADNKLQGDEGGDLMEGLQGDDDIRGQRGDDEIYAGGGADDVRGGFGADKIWGAAGSDTLDGNQGDDEVRGNQGDDFILGGSGHDFLYGGADNDSLFGGVGEDHLYGGAGADHLSGGGGVDHLTGGAGADTFWFDDPDNDVIMDFGDGADTIDLTAFSQGLNPDGSPATGLTYIGSSKFTGQAREVRFNDEWLKADMDGDGITDWKIQLVGVDDLAFHQVHTGVDDWGGAPF